GRLAQDHAIGGVVIDDQDAAAMEILNLSRRLGLDRDGLIERRHEMERAALADSALDREPAAHALDQPAADAQPEPCAAVSPSRRRVGLLEVIEYDVEFVRRAPRA